MSKLIFTWYDLWKLGMIWIILKSFLIISVIAWYTCVHIEIRITKFTKFHIRFIVPGIPSRLIIFQSAKLLIRFTPTWPQSRASCSWNFSWYPLNLFCRIYSLLGRRCTWQRRRSPSCMTLAWIRPLFFKPIWKSPCWLCGLEANFTWSIWFCRTELLEIPILLHSSCT